MLARPAPGPRPPGQGYPRPTMAPRSSVPPVPASPRPAGRQAAPPVLVRQVRGEVVEAVHRGHVVEADAAGALRHVVGDPGSVTYLRSTVKPLALAALVEAGGVEAFELSAEELAVLAASHSGEDVHVRTLHGLLRRVAIPQAALACGTDGAPLDALTRARLARDGERPSPLRHQCSGAHAGMLLLARLGDWPLDAYWEPGHPAQVAQAAAVAGILGAAPGSLPVGVDACGSPTWAAPLATIARAYAFLADPSAVPAADPRHRWAAALARIRDALLAHPVLLGGSRDRLDTSVMKALPGRLVVKGGAEGLRAVAILRGRRGNGAASPASGLVVRIEDGGGHARASWAATVEALHQAGVLDGQPLRELARYHRPVATDPRGRPAAEAVPAFELAPVGELVR